MTRVLLCVALLCAACPPAPVVPQPDADAMPPPPPMVVDASVEPIGDAGDSDATRRPKRDALPPTTTCGRACVQLQSLGCQEGAPTPHGETCESVCLRTNAFPGVKLPAACLVTATTVNQARSCGVKCGTK